MHIPCKDRSSACVALQRTVSAWTRWSHGDWRGICGWWTTAVACSRDSIWWTDGTSQQRSTESALWLRWATQCGYHREFRWPVRCNVYDEKAKLGHLFFWISHRVLHHSDGFCCRRSGKPSANCQPIFSAESFPEGVVVACIIHKPSHVPIGNAQAMECMRASCREKLSHIV